MVGLAGTATVLFLVVLWMLVWHGGRLDTHNDPQAWAAEVSMFVGAANLVVTVVLACATIAYVLLTRRLATSSSAAAGAAMAAVEATRAQLDILEQQLAVDRETLDHTKAALEREREASEEARQLARRSADEATRARLVTTTPVVEVNVGAAPFDRASGGSLGSVDAATFADLVLAVTLAITMHNHGPGPAVVSPEGALAPDGSPGGWAQPLTVVLPEGGSRSLLWTWTVAAADLIPLDRRQVHVAVASRALADTGVVDVHRWHGHVGCSQSGPGTYSHQTVQVVADGELAAQHRRWPDDLNQAGTRA